jgi:hypothetical protein
LVPTLFFKLISNNIIIKYGEVSQNDQKRVIQVSSVFPVNGEIALLTVFNPTGITSLVRFAMDYEKSRLLTKAPSIFSRFSFTVEDALTKAVCADVSPR